MKKDDWIETPIILKLEKELEEAEISGQKEKLYYVYGKISLARELDLISLDDYIRLMD